LSPEREPSPHVVGKVVRLVKNAISQGYAGKNRVASKPKPEPQRELVFYRPICRLAAIGDFNAELICLNIGDQARAKKFAAACEEISSRCQQIRKELDRRFSLGLFTKIEFSDVPLARVSPSKE
jgi:hypothetical protein